MSATVEVDGQRADGTQTIALSSEHGSREIYIRGLPGRGSSSADAAAALGLLTAMAIGHPLEVSRPLSPVLLPGLREAQRVLEAWNDGLRRVPLLAETREPAPRSEPAGGIAAFFSGGVDSFHTALERRDELTHLILIHGFDVGLDESGLRDRVSGMAATVARRLGLELVEIETDVRRAIDPYLRWSMGHGFALAAVGLCLQEHFSKILIPASYTYEEMHPWGTHPLLDPLWSTELTAFVHDGFGVDRFEKITRISSSETALEHLRVCWENPGGAYNCGRCEKCVRTMISLAANGSLQRCTTLPSELRPEAVEALVLSEHASRAFARQNLRAMESSGTAPELARALRLALRRSAGMRGLPRRTAARLRRYGRRLGR